MVEDLSATSAGAAALLAALLALFAVWYPGRLAQQTRDQAALAAQDARDEAAQERRLQFELGVLAEMSRQHGITGLQHLAGYARSIIRSDSPDEDLPLRRTRAVGREIEEAIDRRTGWAVGEDRP